MNLYKKIRAWLYLFGRKRGKLTVDFVRGPGYYLTVGLLGYDPRSKPYQWNLKDGKTAIFRLIDWEGYRDPWDMIKQSKWQLLKFKGEKPINECTVSEFIKIYYPYVISTKKNN